MKERGKKKQDGWDLNIVGEFIRKLKECMKQMQVNVLVKYVCMQRNVWESSKCKIRRNLGRAGERASG
jgi:hypothetical protein